MRVSNRTKPLYSEIGQIDAGTAIMFEGRVFLRGVPDRDGIPVPIFDVCTGDATALKHATPVTPLDAELVIHGELR